MPKRGKMVMGNRDLGPHDESKDFTDKLGPLKRWLESQVGRNWDRVYSEIKQAFPNTNKQNHHLIETHLLGYVERNVIVEKLRKGRRVYSIGVTMASANCRRRHLHGPGNPRADALQEAARRVFSASRLV